uniref:Zinc finger protein 687-like n=1 Tax=Sinocyclocheilus anshuiensis TaxID=1608454 RepID=A0A671PQE2_9TELE
MGDMKTPDFDDLLAAFDIPDIDAKEAIQSTPDEVEGHQGAGGGSLIKPGDASVGGSSALRSPSPSTDSQSDPSIVSVIVKNRVRPEPFDGSDSSVPDPLNHNGFVSSSGSVHMSQSRCQPNGEQWPICSSKATPETAGALESSSTSKQGSNIFNKLKPLMAQGAGDSVGRTRKMQLLQQQHIQQEINLEGADKAKAPAIPSGTSGAASPFFPPPKPLLSTPSTASSSSPSSSSPSVGSRVSGAVASSPLSTSLMEPFNGSPRLSSSAFRRVDSDEEDSDPDSRGSLVIHESTDSPTPPKLSRRLRSPPENSQSPSLPPSTSISPSTYPKAGDTPLASPASPRAQQNWLSAPVQTGTGKSLPQEERNPEHVIEERDSPESPEPETPKSSMPTSAVTKRSCSPAVASSSPSAAIQEPKEEEEEMEVDKGSVENGQDAANTDGKDGGKRDGEKMEVDTAQSLPADAGSPSSGGKAVSGGNAPSRPLKVRIKTVKTSTGGITRTVTRVAGKGGTANAGKDASKAQTGSRAGPAKGTKKNDGQVVKCSTLPVSTLEASSAMLAAASKVQNKMVMQSDKMKVSATAVSITKATTLPVAPAVGGISVRPTVSKITNGGTVPCKPASIVNSTGAVISRSQSSLVEAFNKILNSKNLLPSYRPDLSTPPPPEWGLPMPATGYRCLECGDAFALERSLARHYDRRSLRIEVTCNHCAKRLAFFNKCSLLLHAREHKERGLVMQCSHLVMRPVTVEQMIGQQDTTPIGMLSPSLSSTPLSSSTTPTGATPIPSTSSPLKDSPSPGTASTQPSPAHRGPQSPQALMPLPCKKGEALQYHNFKCPECQAQFSSKAELVTHFQQIRATSNSTCMLCSPPMMLPNWCSVSAHQRIHKHRAPHVCPECGGTARQATFQTHLEESCLHFARRIGYRFLAFNFLSVFCDIADSFVVFGGLNSIKSHIQTAHCEVFHKCPNCPMAFKSAQSAQGHITSQHPALTAAQAKMIYKCVMCDTVFTQKPLLYMHFDTHLAKQKVHVFKCPDCTKLYAQKGSMMEHIKTVHRGLSVKAETPPTTSSPVSAPSSNSISKPKPTENNSDELSQGQGEEDEEGEEEEGEHEGEERDEGEEEENEEEDQASSPESGSMEWRCKECKKRYAEREDYIDHMKNEHGKVVNEEVPLQIPSSTFCPSNSAYVALLRHCSEGKRTFSSRLILEKHIRVRHGIRARQTTDRPNAPNTRKRSLPGDGAGSSSELDNEGGAPPIGGGADTDDVAGEDAKRTRESENRPLEQEEDEGTFRCTPCGFTTQDWEEFQHHIPVHCDAENSPQQCLQCGACFASAGSLSRHKFITHRLRQGQHDNRAGNTSPGASPQDGSPSSPKAGEEGEGGVSCRVCGRRFDKASDLNTHFRTHGMAFITAHRTDKPL